MMRSCTRGLLSCVVISWAMLAQSQVKRAIVIGINEYPAIAQASRQLRGALNDARRMAGMLRESGFDTTLLVGAQASHAAVELAISDLEKAKPGDTALFFFSGRGSVAPDPGGPGAGLEPTLATHDAMPNDAQKDIRIGRLERMAGALAGRGVTVVIILDCSYQKPTAQARGEFRHYNNVPKCLDRPGEARSELFRGPGVILAACEARGTAYEWRRDVAGDVWMGAFSDSLTGAIAENHIQKIRPSYADLMSQISAPILDRSRSGYMPGFRPAPGPEALAAKAEFYGKPMAFGQGEGGTTVLPTPTVQEVEKERRTLDRDFRVGFEMAESLDEARQGLLKTQVDGPLKRQLESQIPGLKVAPQFAARPDRLVLLSGTAGGLRATVSGEPVDEPSKPPTFEGRDLNAILRAGLKDYLETTAIAYQLFRMADNDKPTLDIGLSMTAAREQFSSTDPIEVSVSSTKQGLLYLIDYNEGDGVVHLVGVGIVHAPADPSRPDLVVSDLELEFMKDSPPGRVVLRAIVVDPQRVRLPGIQGGPKAKASTLAHLKSLREALKSGKVGWQAAKVVVRVVQ